ncbi:MAG: hypothetical protein R2745_13280 [Vicinamibacterales bacterium]
MPPTTVARVGRDRRVLIASIGGIAAVAKKETPSLWRSIDDGATWTRAHTLGVWMFSSCCTLLVDPGDPDTVYAIATGMVVGGGGAQEFRSRDASASWTELRTPGFTRPFAALPTTPTSLIGQTYQGFAMSRDHGDTWTTTEAGPSEAQCWLATSAARTWHSLARVTAASIAASTAVSPGSPPAA